MKPDTYCGFPRVTRRHWGREVKEFLRYPFTALEEKRVGRGTHLLSGFHLILGVLTIGYLRHWPTSDAGWPIITLGIVIALALPVRDLMQRVPIAEGLAALTAVAQRVTVARTAQIVDAAEVAVGKIEDAAAGAVEKPPAPEDGAMG